MEIFRDLNKLGYKHYLDYTIEELDSLDIKSKEFSIESNLVFDWFRDVMLLDNFIIPYWFIDGEYKVKKYTYSIEPSNRFDEYFDCDSDQYDTYEEARLECLKRLIELCEM